MECARQVCGREKSERVPYPLEILPGTPSPGSRLNALSDWRLRVSHPLGDGTRRIPDVQAHESGEAPLFRTAP